MSIEHKVSMQFYARDDARTKNKALLDFRTTIYLPELVDLDESDEPVAIPEYIAGDYMRHRIIRMSDGGRNVIINWFKDDKRTPSNKGKTGSARKMPSTLEYESIDIESLDLDAVAMDMQDDLIDRTSKYGFRVKGEKKSEEQKLADALRESKIDMAQIQRILDAHQSEIDAKLAKLEE